MWRHQEQDLINWHNNPRKKPLLVRGARQVGKSTLVRNFASNQNLTLHEVNLEKHPNLASVFNSMGSSNILREIEFISGMGPITKNSLIFIDEIQAIPKAVTALRYLYEEKNDVSVIAAGSLLENTLVNENISMPVGRIEYLYIGPMTFSEVLIAKNRQDLLKAVEQATPNNTFSPTAHQLLLDLQRDFLVVGGMPEATAVHLETKSFTEVQNVHRSIVESYKNDFQKYTSSKNINRLNKVLDYMPNGVGKKVKYSAIDPHERSANIGEAYNLLSLAQVIFSAFRSKAEGVPLAASQDYKVFKSFFIDCGLLATMSNIGPISKEQIKQHSFVNEGAIAEQFIAQHLLYFYGSRVKPVLHYWLREGRSNNAEVDFIVQSNREIIPIEVKSGTSGSLKSLQQFMATKNPNTSIRFDTNPISEIKMQHKTITKKGEAQLDNKLISIPLYAVEQLQRIISEAN